MTDNLNIPQPPPYINPNATSAPKQITSTAEDKVTKKVMAVELYNILFKKRMLIVAEIATLLLTVVTTGWIKIGIAAAGVGVAAVFLAKDFQFMKYLESSYNIEVIKLSNYLRMNK